MKTRTQSAGRTDRRGPAVTPPKRFPSRILVTAFLVCLVAGASWWFMARASGIQCDSLAPLTVLATLAAFLISVCFRQMGRYRARSARWFLFGCILLAAATLFTDFRYVRRYRGSCDQPRQPMQQR